VLLCSSIRPIRCAPKSAVLEIPANFPSSQVIRLMELIAPTDAPVLAPARSEIC